MSEPSGKLPPCGPDELWCKGPDGPEAGPDSPITPELVERLGACGVQCAGGDPEGLRCGLRTALSAWVTRQAVRAPINAFGVFAVDIMTTLRLEADIVSGKADPAKCLTPLGSPQTRETSKERAWRRRHEDRLYE